MNGKSNLNPANSAGTEATGTQKSTGTKKKRIRWIPLPRVAASLRPDRFVFRGVGNFD